MFVDKVQVTLRAGKGGDGVVSFRHEKFIDKGGPDGGDGGRGGNIVVIASNSQNTLAQFRFNKELLAPDGKPGGKRRKAGRSGENLEVYLPVGTVINDLNGNILADLTSEGQTVIVAKGGKGGFGNGHFKSSTRQTPRFAEKGEPGQEFQAYFELKMIADVGLVGLPNAGKSSLIAAISNAKPQIANYPFTTLIPNLGVVDVYDRSILFADIPGLIEGASLGKGLGDEFLRHVERTKVIVHLIDIMSEDLLHDYQVIQNELSEYKVDLTQKPQIIVITKSELGDPEYVQEQKNILAGQTKSPIVSISSHAQQGLDELKKLVYQEVTTYQEQEVINDVDLETTPVISLSEADQPWKIQKVEDYFIVTGDKIERFALRTDYSNEEAVARLKDIMRKTGILHALERADIQAGDAIYFSAEKIGPISY